MFSRFDALEQAASLPTLFDKDRPHRFWKSALGDMERVPHTSGSLRREFGVEMR